MSEPVNFINRKQCFDDLEEFGTTVKAKENEKMQSCRGARPDEKSDLSVADVCSVNSVVDEVSEKSGTEWEGTATEQIVKKTLVGNSSELGAKATYPQSEATKTNAEVLVQSKVHDAWEKVNQPKTNDKKKKKKVTCRQQKTVTSASLGFEFKLNIKAAAFFVLLAFPGGTHAFEGPRNVVVKIGESVVLTSRTDLGYPLKIHKDDKLIYSGYNITENFKNRISVINDTDGQYNLSIYNADEKMAGIYTFEQVEDWKRKAAMVTVIGFNISATETNVIAEAVIFGNKLAGVLWQIIDGDTVLNATEKFTLISSDMIEEVERQKVTTALDMDRNLLHRNVVCRLTMVFQGPNITLKPPHEMAANTVTYTISCGNSKNSELINSTDESLTHSFNLYFILRILMIGVLAVVAVALVAVSIIFDY